ncbi:MAG: hypothetical protein IJB87_00545 [Alistipes sp.]|nr:hypothetical protein [Rikenellaceae bacterium]MBQ3147836.1 hypothetical protein [Alistipes sp.]MBQ4128122.1 hypothetical protein [Alistipes sp.]
MRSLRVLIFIVLLSITSSAVAQERVTAYSTVDITNHYLWRGQRLADVSIQPVLGIKWRGLNFFAWGNTQVAPPANQDPVKFEIDLFLKYQLTPRFNVALKDVYTNTRGNGFFSYGRIGEASHGVELVLNYDWRYLITEWTTTIFGHDGLNKKGERSYSSYLLTTVPFRIGKVNFGAMLGVVPYYTSRYDDNSSGFHVNMVSLKATYDIPISERSGYKLPVYSQFMVNPSNEQAYLQVGCKVILFD